MNWGKYDAWRLSTPWDNEREIEVFQTKNFNYYHTEEKLIEKFDKNLLMYIGDGSRKDDDAVEEYAEELAEELGLFYDDYQAIESFLENERNEEIAAMEEKWEHKRELRRLGDE